MLAFLASLGPVLSSSFNSRIDLTCVANQWPPRGLDQRTLYAFSGGERGTNIGDGGDDVSASLPLAASLLLAASPICGCCWTKI